jgi:hypothetical protein
MEQLHAGTSGQDPGGDRDRRTGRGLVLMKRTGTRNQALKFKDELHSKESILSAGEQ